jgi:hypothetical protein
MSKQHPFWSWCKRHQSVIIGGFLMAASSGLDGVYMTLWMPPAVWWLGLVLNTGADFADLYLGDRMGRLMRSTDGSKRWGGLLALGLGQLIAIGYSWYFGYLQLRRVLPAIEGSAANGIALVAAGFIPLMLAVLGIEDGLQHFSSKRFFAESEPTPAVRKPKPLACPVCGITAGKNGKPFIVQEQVNAHQRAHAGSNGHEPQVEPAQAEGVSQ